MFGMLSYIIEYRIYKRIKVVQFFCPAGYIPYDCGYLINGWERQ